MSNLACLGYEEGERVLRGATQRRGKVWQQRSGSPRLDQLVRINVAQGYLGENKTESNIVRDFLRPERLHAHYGSPPIAVQWGEQAQMRFNDRQFVVFGEIAAPSVRGRS